MEAGSEGLPSGDEYDVVLAIVGTGDLHDGRDGGRRERKVRVCSRPGRVLNGEREFEGTCGVVVAI